MYSVVLLMALGTAGEAPDQYCGGYGGYCGGYGGYCGSYGGCGYGGGYYGGYCGGYSGGYCSSPCYSYASYPVYSCAPMYCYPMQAAPKMEEKKKKMEEVSTRATIVVHLPADAKLTFDGEGTKSTSATRTFVTPELKPGTSYSYTVKAEVMKDGKPVVIEQKKVSFRAGQTTEVTLGEPSGIASR